MLLTINYLFSPNVLDVTISRLIVASLFNAAQYFDVTKRMLEDKVNLLVQLFMRRKLRCVKRELIVLLMFNQVFTLEPVTDGSLKGMMHCCLGHYHLIVKGFNLVINQIPFRMGHIGFS
jgi:hypothetical protein